VHGSVLQNKKYIKFAYENTVEVISLGSLDKGIAANDRKAATYRAKNEEGQEVEYLLEWPNLTVKEVSDLRSSKAASYNNTGRIPYTAIVNPHTLEEMASIKGGYGTGKLMDEVETAKKALRKAHGPSVSRRDLDDVKDDARDIREDLAGGKLKRALRDVAKLKKKMAKEAQALRDVVAKVEGEALAVATKRLDELEALIDRDEKKDAARELRPLSRALKKTSLEERANQLLEKTKS